MYVRIALSWRANIAFSSSLTSSRASLATCSTCSLLISTAFSVTSRCHPERSEGDRKSTRLNSSHSQISYAVFCLKKKKIKKRTNYELISDNDIENAHNLATLI